jgi:DNA-binding MarR family transcriptional regulator
MAVGGDFTKLQCCAMLLSLGLVKPIFLPILLSKLSIGVARMSVTERDVGQYISKLHNKIRRELDQLAVRNHISGAQAHVLIYILVETKNRDLFQKDIEEKYSIRPSTASALLKKMIQAGLISREPLPQDQRLKRIIPTAKAQQARDGVFADLLAMETKLTQNIAPADLAVFFRVIETMITNLD